MRRWMIVACVLFAGCSDTGDTEGTADGAVDAAGAEDTGGAGYGSGQDANDTAASVDAADSADISSTCEGLADGTPCDDGDACTEATTCVGGQCGGGSTVACDSGPCKVASCDPKDGCRTDPVAEGTACSLGCFGSATCVGGTCEADAATQVKCPPPTEPCVESLACDPTTGECTVPIYKSVGVACDTDGDVCTAEVCNDQGWCGVTGAVETCATQQQNNPCWTWQCNKKSGCQQIAFVEGASCDDGNGCTGGDSCTTNQAGQKLCVGTPLVVADNNPCTDDKCAGGTVTHTPLTGTACEATGPCSSGQCDDGACVQTPVADGTACGLGKACTGGQCTDVACTPACGACEACDATSGTCTPKANGLPCADDGNPCTTDACSSGLCSHAPMSDGVSCGAGMACLAGACQSSTCDPPCDECQACSVSLTCEPTNGACTDDGDPCTTDTCSGGACAHPDAPNGTPCAGGSCQGGTCQPDASPVTIAENLDSPWAIAVDDTSVYFVQNDNTAGTVSKVPKSGGAVTDLASSLIEPCAIAISGTDVFWLERAGGSGGILGRVPKGGGAAVPLATGLHNAQNHLALDATHVYFGDGKGGGGGAIRRVPIAGGAVQTLVDTGIVNLSTAIAVDDTWVYFDNDSDDIKRVPKAGGAVEHVGTGSPSSLRIVGSTLYFTDYSNGFIKKLVLGGEPVTLADGADSAGELAVDGSHVYWIEFDSNGKAARVPLGGGAVQTISTQANTIGIALDATHVYWSVSKFTNQGKIMRMVK